MTSLLSARLVIERSSSRRLLVPGLFAIAASIGSSSAAAQSTTFGPQQWIESTPSSGAKSMYATDLDGDGDDDVLAASDGSGASGVNNIAWYENLGGGSFGVQQVITTSALGAVSVYATDLDGDGDADVLSASYGDSKIAWYENLGGGSFGAQQVITTSVDAARSVYATDLDGDGDADVLSTSLADNKIAWYENRGGGSFRPQQVITTSADAPNSVYATDLDGDGDADVLSASLFDDKIAWYENFGGGSFGPQQVITTSADSAQIVYATDLDGDGDADVLSASFRDDKIAWYENLGGGSFGAQQVITTSARGARSVYATDLDGDGDADVLSASYTDGKIAWYENLGGGSFGPQQEITTAVGSANFSVYATDLDGDGDVDVLSAPPIAWYENGFSLPNDNCSNPGTLGLGAAIFNNEYAGDSGVDMGCVFAGETADIWFSYTASSDSPLTIDLSGSSFDTGVAVWTGECGALTQVGCDDDGGAGLTSRLSFTATAGTTYLIQVGGFGGASGDGVINVIPPPANDDCSGAIPIGIGETVYSNVSAGDSGVAMGCVFAGETSDMWFSYTASSDSPLTIDLSGSSFDTGAAVWTGECGALTQVGCNDDGGDGLTSRLSFTASAGTTYYLQVGGWNGASGDGVITISEDSVELVCAGNTNSTGVGAVLEFSGSLSVAVNNLTLTVEDLPLNQGVLLVNSPEKLFVANPNGSQGNLCIYSSDLGRHVNDILSSGATGTASLVLDLTSIPTANGFASVVVGERRYWQAWYRDVDGTGAATSNFSSAIGVTFN